MENQTPNKSLEPTTTTPFGGELAKIFIRWQTARDEKNHIDDRSLRRAQRLRGAMG